MDTDVHPATLLGREALPKAQAIGVWVHAHRRILDHLDLRDTVPFPSVLRYPNLSLLGVLAYAWSLHHLDNPDLFAVTLTGLDHLEVLGLHALLELAHVFFVFYAADVLNAIVCLIAGLVLEHDATPTDPEHRAVS